MMTRTSRGLNVATVTVNATKARPKILRLEGYVRTGTSATQYFLQVFNSAPTSGTTVPLRSLQVLGGTGFTFDYGMIGLDTSNIPSNSSSGGLVIGISTTNAVYTNVAGTTVLADINVEIEEFELENVGITTVTGPTVSGKLQIVDTVEVPVNCLTAEVTETAAAASYFQLFAKSPSVNDIPVFQKAVPANTLVRMNFGKDTVIRQRAANGTDYSHSLYAAMSLTSGLFDGAGAGTVTVTYNAQT